MFRRGVVLRCVNCGEIYEPDPFLFKCRKCGSLLEVLVPVEGVSWSSFRGRGVWRYRPLLPVSDDVKPVTMGEGGTPLIRCENIEAWLRDRYGVAPRVYVKFEGANPTGSFKDRGMTVIASIARSLRVKLVAAASTGNTASSAAAYTARAGLKMVLVLPKGKVAKGKLGQSILYGATIIEVDGSFDDAMKAVQDAVEASKGGIYPFNSFNPWRLEGQKTIAFEIAEEIGVPDFVIVPVGNGGNISAIWKGFNELHKAGLIDKLPRMVGVQAEGAAPLATAFEKGLDKPLFVDKPETVATAIRIGRPVNWMKALRAVKESGGLFTKVSDDEILSAMRMLASMEGVGAEPAGASSLAGLLKLVEDGTIGNNDTVVLVATGHALKDPDAMLRASTKMLHASSSSEAAKLLLEMAEKS
ncbi:threonine synthase [Pyrolobus fumarii]